MQIIFSAPAYIADPGGEVGHGNELIPQPCEIGQKAAVHLACLAFITGDGGIREILAHCCPFCIASAVGFLAVDCAFTASASCTIFAPELLPNRVAPTRSIACASASERT